MIDSKGPVYIGSQVVPTSSTGLAQSEALRFLGNETRLTAKLRPARPPAFRLHISRALRDGVGTRRVVASCALLVE